MGRGLSKMSRIPRGFAIVPIGIRSGYVCDQCNSDLNSQLEVPFQKIEPDLLLFPFARWDRTHPTIRRVNPLQQLTHSYREILSRWAAKTTCVIESVAPGRKQEQNWISADSRLLRSEPSLPDGWAVFAMLHTPTRPTFMSGSRTWSIDPLIPENLRAGLARSPRTVIQIGSLILVSVFLDIPGLTLRAQKRRHYPLCTNIKMDWADYADPGQSVRQSPDEDPMSSVNISLRFLDTLSIGWEP